MKGEMDLKKILILGGSNAQLPFIKVARDMGHHVITCDYIEDNPGHKYAHEYFNVSTTDKEGVLALAREQNIDGIVCYASDAAAPTVAYVAENANLYSHPYKSVEILSNKDLFRNFQKENNLNVPRAKGYSSLKEAIEDFPNFKLPVMIKPIDSSGSRGVSIIEKASQLKEKVEIALSYSRAKKFIIEEYIENGGFHIGGDGFAINGELVFYAFANEHFPSTNKINQFVPIGASWPYNKPNHIHLKIKSEIQRVLDLLDMKTGAFNFDVRIDQDENIYIIEIGARNGGDWYPQVIKYATDVDLMQYTIRAALGEDCSKLSMVEPKGYWAVYLLYSEKNGVFKEIIIDDDFKEQHVVECELLVKDGDNIAALSGAHEKLGTMILKFSTLDEMIHMMETMENYIKVIINDS